MSEVFDRFFFAAHEAAEVRATQLGEPQFISYLGSTIFYVHREPVSPYWIKMVLPWEMIDARTKARD